jgi:23S rRNA (guanosine2251-2'-O)-methyltransferase
MDKQNTSYIYGRQPVIEALKAKTSIEKIFLLSGGDRDFEKEIRELIKSKTLTWLMFQEKSSTGWLQEIIKALLLLSMITNIMTLMSSCKKSNNPMKCLFLIMLDHMTDVRNLEQLQGQRCWVDVME